MDRDGGVVAAGGASTFYERVNELLEEAGFDALVEERCRRFFAPKIRRPSLAPGVYFQRLLIHVAAFNLSLILRREAGVGTPRGLQDHRNRLFFCFWAVWMLLQRLRNRIARQPATSAGRFWFLPLPD